MIESMRLSCTPILNGYTITKDGRKWARYMIPEPKELHLELHVIDETLSRRW